MLPGWHAGDVTDRKTHPQYKEDIDGQVGDWKIDLQAGRPAVKSIRGLLVPRPNASYDN